MFLSKQSGDGAGISVAIVDKQPMFRAGIVHVLGSHKQLSVVAEGGSAMDAMRIAREMPVDIMLLDLDIPGGGMQVLTGLSQTWPAIRLVVLTASEQQADVASAMQCGARGYILKDVSPSDLVAALSAVGAGEVYLTPSLGARLLARPSSAAATSSPPHKFEDLTTRETQILTQVSVGATNKEIARRLNITEKTVKFYMTNIMQKLQVRNRVEAVVVMRDRTRTSA